MKKVSSAVLRKIKNDAANRLPSSKQRFTNLFTKDDIVPKGTVINAHRQSINVKEDSVMVFADEEPQFNWAHNCRYMMYNSTNGDFKEDIPARFPPDMKDPEETLNDAFHRPVAVGPLGRKLWPRPWPPRLPLLKPRGRRYAVLFSGASNNRHVNDMEFLYRSLRDIYHFSSSHIYVLNYDGTVNYSGSPHPVEIWPGDDTAYRMPVRAEGTKADLDDVLNEIKGKIKKEDMLFIHTNNHGGHNGTESYLCTRSGDDYLASDFADKLAELPRYESLLVMMEQCHSGGFNAPIAQKSTARRTSVASACLENRSSIGGPEFDPFARDWIAAITGNDPYGATLASNPDENGNNKVSAIEAFNYADAVHDPYDTPIFTEASEGDGHHYLNQRYRFLRLYRGHLAERLKPFMDAMPAKDYRKAVRDNLVPNLMSMEMAYAEDPSMNKRNLSELKAELDSAIDKALK